MKILLVEDDSLMRWILDSMLNELGHEVHNAANGDEALTMLFAQQVNPDCIILDRIMPGICGLELLKTLRSSEPIADTPVIMLTSAASIEEMTEGLSHGAQLYLAKPASKDLLRAALNLVSRNAAQRRSLHDELAHTQKALRLADSMHFTYRSPAEANQLACILAHLAANPGLAVIPLAELLLNAVEHGNLGIGYAEKSRLIEEDGLADEIAARLLSPAFRDKAVRVAVSRLPGGGHSVVIQDEGQGFDWQPYMDFSTERAFDLHGRGIAMANRAEFSLRYMGKGNVVEVRLGLQTGHGEGLPANGVGELSPGEVG